MDNNQEYSMNMVIDHFEEKFAVLKGEDGQELHWPIKKLPDDCAAGMSINLKISTAKSLSEEREKLAKEMLNEILKSNEN